LCKVRHGVSAVARSVTSKLSTFTSWLSTEWNSDGAGSGGGGGGGTDDADDAISVLKVVR
jgi:hypothetical protein